MATRLLLQHSVEQEEACTRRQRHHHTIMKRLKITKVDGCCLPTWKRSGPEQPGSRQTNCSGGGRGGTTRRASPRQVKVQVRPLPNPAPLIKRQRDNRACAVRANVKDSLPSLLCFPFSFLSFWRRYVQKKVPRLALLGPRLDCDWPAIGSIVDEVILNNPHIYIIDQI